jgi:hypothetical protein
LLVDAGDDEDVGRSEEVEGTSSYTFSNLIVGHSFQHNMEFVIP